MMIEIDLLSLIIGCVMWECLRVYKDYLRFNIEKLISKNKDKQEMKKQKDNEYKKTSIGIVASEQTKIK